MTVKARFLTVVVIAVLALWALGLFMIDDGPTLYSATVATAVIGGAVAIFSASYWTCEWISRGKHE